MDEHDRALLERVNPVYKTAKTTLYQLALAGDADARALVDRLGLTLEQTQGTCATEASAEVAQANAIFLEARFRTMQAMAEASGAATIVDLPCGYTPRGLKCARRGLDYVGLDLPVTIAELEPEVMALARGVERDRIRYAAVDATDPASLSEALTGVKGPVCVTTEGLLMYLNESETAALCEGIRGLLLRYGGCWICADPEMLVQNLEIMRAVAGNRYREVFESTRRAHEERADIHVGSPVLMIMAEGDLAEAAAVPHAFLERHGLEVERLVVARYMPRIDSLKVLRPVEQHRVRRGMEACAYWRCVPASDIPDARPRGVRSGFDVSCSRAQDTLVMSVSGRMDTLTSPQVLAEFDRHIEDGGLHHVELDCSGLTYISSAGLRVLMVMRKRCDGGVIISGARPEILEIMEQTGFSEMLTFA